MESDTNKLLDLLRRAYEKLSECDDSSAGGDDTWKSKEQRKLMEDIADALDIKEEDRL